MFRALERNASSVLMSVTVLLVMLIVLFGLLHFASTHTPTPISNFVNKAGSLATPAGWNSNS